MTTLNDFNVTDDVTDNLATYNNRFLGSMFSADNTNTETITATKELADSDCIYQVITASGASRTVELPPEATTNHPHLIYNTSASNTVPVKDDSGTTTFITLAADEWALFFPVNGEAWEMVEGRVTLKSYFDTLYGAGIVLSSASPRVYTSNDTWTKPAGLHHIIVEVVGGGGGGGGTTAGTATNPGCAMAGGGGEYAKKKILEAALGATETVTVGAGGTAGAAGNNAGGTGGTSSLGTLVTAIGGTGGDGDSSGVATLPFTGISSGGAGGTGGTGGDITIKGTTGLPGVKWSTTVTTGSVGGNSHLSGLIRSTTAGTTDEDGVAGAAYGGGGTGGRSTNNAGTDRAGGAGAAGVVIVWEYVTA